MKQHTALTLLTVALSLAPCPTVAGPADVLDAAAKAMPDGRYIFIATIAHKDVDFSHFADAFEVVAPDGTVIARRILVHPHIEEQPVTRATNPVAVPANTTTVTIRARDKIHGTTGRQLELQLDPGPVKN